MGNKRHRMSIGLDREDVQFLDDTGVFKNTSEGVRWCVKFCRIYGVPAIKRVKTEENLKT